VEQPLQLPQKVLRQFLTVANEEFSLGFEGACDPSQQSQMLKKIKKNDFEGACDPSPTVANVKFF
jgi:hypothetical protein